MRKPQPPPIDWSQVPVVVVGVPNPAAWQAIIDSARRFEEENHQSKIDAERRSAVQQFQEAAEIAQKSDQVVSTDFSI